MTPTTFVILHGGSGLEITLLGYLFRVVLHLFAFGGVVVLVLWGLDVVGNIHSGTMEKWNSEENDR